MTLYDLAQLRHAYKQLVAGTVVDQKQFANGLLAPVIQNMERELMIYHQVADALASSKRLEEIFPSK